jgi:hypothetical protein
MLNKATPASLLDFDMNVSADLAAEASIIETPLFINGPLERSEAAAELLTSDISPIRAGGVLAILPATEAGVVFVTPVLAVPLVDNEALP